MKPPAASPPLAAQAGSRFQIPAGHWKSLLDCLAQQFTGIPREVWQARLDAGRVLDSTGRPLAADSAVRAGQNIQYFREVENETPIPFEAHVLYADEHLVVADKPHFLPVAPTGRFVLQSLLTRLVQTLGNPNLVPLHRIDRGTAGLVLFSAKADTRSRYQALFREQKIKKHYQALAPALPGMQFPLLRKTRLEAGEPFFRMQEVNGAANTETSIAVLDATGPLWRYGLTPVTGKKHQLRVHMAGLGAPIHNDDFYPLPLTLADDDFSRPLQLLAQQLAFVDPISGREHCFESRRCLLPLVPAPSV